MKSINRSGLIEMEVFGGTAGWSYADWHGPFYPEKKQKGFSELKFYADFFDCVEVNSTYYRHFPPAASEKWLKEVDHNPKFVFIVKLYKEFTHGSRGKDEEFDGNKKIILDFLSPLREQGKLGGVLVQFSEYFKENIPNKSYVSLIAREFHDLTLFFELRHASWYTERGREFLKQNGINAVAIDQPLLKGMAELDTELFGQTGYIRLHGRNSGMWSLSRHELREGTENDNMDRNARYDYLYGVSELDEIERKIRKVKERCDRVYVVANNHPMGKAVANALELVKRLRNVEKVRIPDTVIKYFPELGKIAERIDVSPLGDLFG